jgi:hypothetical protein
MNNKGNNTNNKSGRVLAVPSVCELYPGICLTTEEKARIKLSQGSRRDSKNAHCQDTHTLQNSLKPPQYKLKQTQIKTNTVQDTPK